MWGGRQSLKKNKIFISESLPPNWLPRKVTSFTGSPAQANLDWSRSCLGSSICCDTVSLPPALEQLGVLAPSLNNVLPPWNHSACYRFGKSPHPVFSPERTCFTVAAATAVSQGAALELPAKPAAARSEPQPPPQPPRLRFPRPGDERGGAGRPRAPSAPSRSAPQRSALPAVPPRPAAPPPPRALRSRDVRAARPRTRWGAGRQAETDPASVRAGSR